MVTTAKFPEPLDRDFLFLDQVDHAEICRIVHGHFQRGWCPSRDRQVLSNPDNSKFIVINFDKAHRISAITSAGLTAHELERIRDDVRQKLVDNQQDAVGQTVLFCGGRFEGRFLYKGEFQMAPMPANAPQMEHAFGAHPYLFQVRYKKGTDQLTNILRIRKRSFELIPIVNGLSRTRFWLPMKYTTFQWGTLPSSPDPTSKWFKVGYDAGYLEMEDTVLDTQSPRIERVSKDLYYRGFPNPSFPLVMPDNFEFLLEKAFLLPQIDFQRLYRACMWFAMAQEIWRTSASSSFVSIVSALESLMDKPEKCSDCGQSVTEGLEICPQCRQPKFRLTQAFKVFLEAHVPRLSEKPEIRNIIYQVRSGLAHGLADPLRADVTPWMLFDHPEQAYQEMLQVELLDCTSDAIVNWLVSRLSPTEQGVVAIR